MSNKKWKAYCTPVSYSAGSIGYADYVKPPNDPPFIVGYQDVKTGEVTVQTHFYGCSTWTLTDPTPHTPKPGKVAASIVEAMNAKILEDAETRQI
jgi:hypothetical protein